MIGKHNFVKIEDVQNVEGLKHNILSISQLCDNELAVILFWLNQECKDIKETVNHPN